MATIHEYVYFPELKAVSKQYEATITEYLTAVLIYAIYQSNMNQNFRSRNYKRPVKVCIPVNLRRFFKSKTVSNFFSYFIVEAGIEKDKLLDFDSILRCVKTEFQEKLTFENINQTMSALVKFGKNPVLNYVILPVKLAMVRLSYQLVRRYMTTTFSNVGRFGVIKEYQDYIDHVLFMIAPEPVEKMKVSSISFGDVMAISFTTNMMDTGVEKAFLGILEKHGISTAVQSNGVLPIDFAKEHEKIAIAKPDYPDKPNRLRKVVLQIYERREQRKKNLWEMIRKRMN